MIRGWLPWVWFSLIVAFWLLFSVEPPSPNDPTYADWVAIFGRLHSPTAPLLAFTLLALITWLLGLPSWKELGVGAIVTAAGVLSLPAFVVISAVAGMSIGWSLVALYFTVTLPLLVVLQWQMTVRLVRPDADQPARPLADS